MRVSNVQKPVFEKKIHVGYRGHNSKSGRDMYSVKVQFDCGCMVEFVWDFEAVIRAFEVYDNCPSKHTDKSLMEFLAPRVLGLHTSSKRPLYWEKMLNKYLWEPPDWSKKK